MKIPIAGVCKKNARLMFHTICKMIQEISIMPMIVIVLTIEIRTLMKLSKGNLDNPGDFLLVI